MKNHVTQFREQENLAEGLRSSCFRYPVSKSFWARSRDGWQQKNEADRIINRGLV